MSNPLPGSHDASPRFTYGDYRQWNDGERWELIGGQAHAMAPAPSTPHQRLVTELSAQLTTQLRGSRCESFVAPFDVRLPRADEPDDDIVDVVQPDLVVVCEPSKLDDRGCRGAPDFVVEVLSSSTAARDQITKLELYERHGVREYWLVHPTDRIVTVHRRAEDGRFARPLVREANGTLDIGVIDGVQIDWDVAFGRSGSQR